MSKPFRLPLLFFLSLSLTVSACIGAQETADTAPEPDTPYEWVPVDSPHLGQEEYVLLRGMILHPSSIYQESALDHIRDQIREGKTDAGDPNVVHILEWVGLDSLTVRETGAQVRALVLPTTRIKVLGILALLGGAESVRIVNGIIGAETEPAVLEAAYRARASMAEQADTRLIATMVKHLGYGFPNGPHDGLILAIMNTISRQHLLFRNMGRNDVFDALFAIYQDNKHIAKVNETAFRLLKVLMGI